MALAITTHALIAPQRNFRQRQPKNFTGFSVRVVRGGSSQAFLAKPRVLRARTVRVHAEAKEVVSAEEIQGTATTVPTWNADKDLGAIVADQEKALSKVSFGTIGLTVGLSLLTYGFGAFFQFLPLGSLSSLMLIYGFPISLIGAALQYAKLDPVPCLSYSKAVALRDEQATSIQLQVRSDVTRYRYGDEQHLDEALKRIFRIGQAGGISRKFTPKLTGIQEITVDGKYALVLEFDNTCDFEEFVSRQMKIEAFFGPGVSAPVRQVDRGVEVALISSGNNLAADDDDVWEILPPLQPGLPARRVRKGSV
eukprot:CAMPEP_0114251474 /NCGR_PEP_ID=MMETSP0058-20121206/15290_1 /TAXON_ID=36894 /ORGANISM="Pyramimonas parkeae, CCMP726" /LENGTH=308 /DNA_ID=CAMNT_0001365279 /DNA_START=38 /DNA_END=964 /DNA_ORIENTATION=-